jgi:hypothetical protein
MQRFILVVLAVLVLAATATPASAATRIAWGGTGYTWDSYWGTKQFATRAGSVDIWYTCRPQNNGARLRLVLHRSDGRERVFYPPCDRRGRWIHNVAVTTRGHEVFAEIDNGQAMGWISVYVG